MKKICLFIFVVTVSQQVCGQQSKRELLRAKALFEKLAYTDAITAFHEVLIKDSTQFEAKEKLADSYRLTGNYSEAEKWYAKVVSDARSTELDRLHYGQMLMNNGQYDKARKWLNLVRTERPADERAQNYLNSMNDLSRFFLDSVSYSLQNLPINGSGNDFSPSFYRKGVVYTSSRKARNNTERHAWTGESFTDLYFSDSSYIVSDFAREITSSLNDGPVAFAGTDMYVTMNVKSSRASKDDLFKLNLFWSHLHDNRWTKIQPLPFNSADYNTAHPALTADGSRLFFSSDAPGGEGGMDLYYCDKTATGWSEPINAGNHINTPGNELFPFVHADGSLFFASNGHEGLGGLDIYVSTMTDGAWSYPKSLSFPLNTPYDDFGFIINQEKTNGYFSSNRPGGKGGDDIYAFIFTPTILDGMVINKQSHESLAEASVKIVEKATGKTKDVVTDSQGNFSIELAPCRHYQVYATHPAYKDPVVSQIKTSCISAGREKAEVIFCNANITVNVLNKFTGDVIDAELEIQDGEGNTVASGRSSALRTVVPPCKEYKIIARNAGMPDVTTYFKTSCIVTDEVVTVKMGIPPADPTIITGIAIDQETKNTLDSAVVIVYDDSNNAIMSVTTDRDGSFVVAGLKGVSRLVFFRSGYFSVTKTLQVEKDRKKITAELPKLQLDKIIQLEGIYYDLGQASIRPDAALVLDNLVKVLRENPSLEIELSAHTDARGKDESNLNLSEKRAKAAAAYIIEKGISETRILGKGYGETQLKNKCGNGAKCTEKQHQENRRTEVKIIKY